MIGVREGCENAKGVESLLKKKKKKAENFPNLEKDTSIQIIMPFPSQLIIKHSNMKDKEKIPIAAKEKK